MTRSAFRALLWEQLRLSGWPGVVGGCFLVFVYIPLLFLWGAMDAFDSKGLIIHITMVHLCGTGMYGVLLFNDGDAQLRPGFPNAFFRLPISTPSLVVFLLTIRCLLLFLFMLFIVIVTQLLFGHISNFGYYIPLAMAVYLWFQAIKWSALACKGIPNNLIVVLMAFSGFYCLYRSIEGSSPVRYLGEPLILWGSALLLTVLAYGLAIWGVRKQRCEYQTRKIQPQESPSQALLSSLLRPKSFVSAFQAQCWHEQRVYGWMFLMVVLVGMGIGIALAANLSWLGGNHIISIAYYVPLPAVMGVGFSIRKKPYAYVYRLPLKNSDLARVRLFVSARMAFVAESIVLVVVSVFVFRELFLNDLEGLFWREGMVDAVSVLAQVLRPFLYGCLCMWLACFMSVDLVLVWAFILLLVPDFMSILKTHVPVMAPWLPSNVLFIAFILFTYNLLVALFSWRRAGLPVRHVIVAAALLIVLASWAAAFSSASPVMVDKVLHYCIWAGMAYLPVLALPLEFHRQRFRANTG